MKFDVYAVKDELQGKYKTPAYVTKEEEIIRNFKWQVNETPIWKSNPADFTLWKLGTFDDESGQFVSDIHMIMNGRSVLNG